MPIHPDKRHRYPSDWALRSRFVRFVRARNRCEWCGIPNGTVRGQTRIVLTTAHVYDHRPEAASLLNLAALCQRCHLRHDRKRHLRNFHDNRDQRRGQPHLPGIIEVDQ